jgi:S1-C subfamily serine protease
MLHPRLFSVALFTFLVLSSGAPAQSQGVTSKEIYQQTLRATAWVLQNKSSGTGWIVDVEQKHLITNAHVVGASTRVQVVFPAFENGRVVPERDRYVKAGKFIRGEVVISDPRHDLALIKLESLPEGVVPLKLAADSTSPGDRVHSIGNPGISEALWLYTSGTVRQVYRRKVRVDDQEVDARVVETQAPINAGDSGGPVVNDEGELVGVNAAISRTGQLFSVCIDVQEVRDFLRDVPRLLTPKTAADFMRSASLNFYKKQFDRAIADYTDAIRLEPKEATAYRNRGLVHVRKGDYEKAVADCSRAIELNPNDPHAYLIRSRAFRQQGEAEKARADLKEVNRIDPALLKE